MTVLSDYEQARQVLQNLNTVSRDEQGRWQPFCCEGGQGACVASNIIACIFFDVEAHRGKSGEDERSGFSVNS